MNSIAAFLSLILLSTGLQAGQATDHYEVLPPTGPQYRENQLFMAFEAYESPRVKRLRERYALDKVVAGEAGEWKRILLLRHWIKSHIEINDDNPTETRGDAFGILDAALKGGGFHCAHFSIVQHAVLNSFGYVARRLGCGPGLPEKGGHHGINEVWVNELGKWVLVDAKYDLHFEKDGLPLSVLEIRDEVWKDGAKQVVPVYGPARLTRQEPAWETRAETYRWCSWETNTNRFTSFPALPSSSLIVLDDEHSRNNTWYRDGKPHWAYNTAFFLPTTRRDWIDWTPNVIRSQVKVEGDVADIFLTSFTPNFQTYQRKGEDGAWVNCSERERLPLNRATNTFAFRVMNLFGVPGPEHGITIVWGQAAGPLVE